VLEGRRERVVLATKFGMAIDDQHRGARPAYVRRAAEDSLCRLRTDRIDLYQLHQPDPEVPIADTLGALAELVREGKVREIGCSNFDVTQLREAESAAPQAGARFVSVQNQYSLLHREPDAGVLAECQRLGLAFLPYFPLASGLLTGKYHRGQPPLLAPGSPAARSRGASAPTATKPRSRPCGRSPRPAVTRCSSWPSRGCSLARRSPRSSPVPPRPSRSRPTWVRPAGA